MDGCTVSGNSATSDCGGIESAWGETMLNNCTIANNTAAQSFGGIVNRNMAKLYLNNCTITGNRSELNQTGTGVRNEGNLYSANTIIAYNSASAIYAYDDLQNTQNIYGNYNICGNVTNAAWGGSGNIDYTYTNGMGDKLFAIYSTISANAFYQPKLANNGG